jgi:hypothetical protein
MLKNKKNILIGIVVVIVLFVGYSVFVKKDPADDAALVSETVGGDENTVGREFLTVLLQIKSLKLDESVFADDSFMSLQDFSSVIVAQPVGRKNPFSPLEGTVLPPEQSNIRTLGQ